MKYPKIEKQTIEIKGNHHPDSLADNFADIAIKAIEDFNPNLYANVDKSYLKAGKFPAFVVQGYLSFDFRKYDKSYRYELFNAVKAEVVKEFKSIFPDPVIDIDFNLNFEPSVKDNLLENNTFTDSAYITGITGFTEFENDMSLLASYVDDIAYVGNDYKLLLMTGGDLIINQTFNDPDEDVYQQYVEEVTEYVSTLDSLSDVNVFINPDKDISGVYYSRFGSSLFYNSSGAVGRGNQWYGFVSPERRHGETPFGKHRLHPAKYLVEFAKNQLTYKVDEKCEYILSSKIGDKLDNYTYTKL